MRNARKPGQEHVEQSGIFGGEQPRQPAIGGVVDGEPRLHAGESAVAGLEGRKRDAKLHRVGPVLGVVDHDIAAAHEGQCGVERFRLGARTGAWARSRLRRAPCRFIRSSASLRLHVLALDHDLDVEPLLRIVEPHQRLGQRRHRFRLVVDRNDDRIDRQGIVVARRQRTASAPTTAGWPGREARSSRGRSARRRCRCHRRDRIARPRARPRARCRPRTRRAACGSSVCRRTGPVGSRAVRRPPCARPRSRLRDE